jgi:hypothetical protein
LDLTSIFKNDRQYTFTLRVFWGKSYTPIFEDTKDNIATQHRFIT